MFGFWFHPSEIEAIVEKKKPMSSEDQLNDAEDNVVHAGRRMAGRMRGLVRREASRIFDQFPILDKYKTQAQIEEVIWETFRAALDEDLEEEEVDT